MMQCTDPQTADTIARGIAWRQFWDTYGVLIEDVHGADIVRAYKLDEQEGKWPPQSLDVDAEERDTSPMVVCSCPQPHDPQEWGGAEFCNYCHSRISPR
jgi:hypothetical protein